MSIEDKLRGLRRLTDKNKIARGLDISKYIVYANIDGKTYSIYNKKEKEIQDKTVVGVFDNKALLQDNNGKTFLGDNEIHLPGNGKIMQVLQTVDTHFILRGKSLYGITDHAIERLGDKIILFDALSKDKFGFVKKVDSYSDHIFIQNGVESLKEFKFKGTPVIFKDFMIITRYDYGEYKINFYKNIDEGTETQNLTKIKSSSQFYVSNNRELFFHYEGASPFGGNPLIREAKPISNIISSAGFSKKGPVCWLPDDKGVIYITGKKGDWNLNILDLDSKVYDIITGLGKKPNDIFVVNK